jgi:hypothetical protein
MNSHTPAFSTPPASGGVLPGSGRAEFGQASASAMSMKWSALHDASGVVAMLAGIAPEAMRAEVRNFPAVMRDTGGWRRNLAEQGIEDLSAVIEPGIAALLAVNARGVNPAPAALALWQEFQAARAALLALTPPAGSIGPRRFT